LTEEVSLGKRSPAPPEGSRRLPGMERVGEQRLPAGPLVARWLGWEVEPPRAGARVTARVAVENAGSATWRSRGETGIQAAYHWLDPLGNPIVWDGLRTPLPRPVAPGEAVELTVNLVAPRPPGRYRVAFDLVEEHRFWFGELGLPTLDVDVDVAPRIAERRLAVVMHGGRDPETEAALAAQDEPLVTENEAAVAHLVAGAVPAPDWSRRVLDAHAEGWAAVGGAIEPVGGPLARWRTRALRPWAPGGGRNPRFQLPLLLPSVLDGLTVGEHEGLPAYRGDDALLDGRIVVRLRPRSGRRPA
jgi:hypothetical protein